MAFFVKEDRISAMQLGREHPWNIRRVSHRHLHDQRNLADLHRLTQAWVPEGVESPKELESSLEDDTWPEDVLLRLEAEIRALQLGVLSKQLSESERLAEKSFFAGQEAAQRRWMQADPTEGSVAPADKRALLLALYQSPLGGRLGPDAFLVRRALITEVTVEWLACPHCQTRTASKNSAFEQQKLAEAQEELCGQQFHWLRGYFNFLNPAITPACLRLHGRCVVSW
jgi:hypothetical protein